MAKMKTKKMVILAAVAGGAALLLLSRGGQSALPSIKPPMNPPKPPMNPPKPPTGFLNSKAVTTAQAELQTWKGKTETNPAMKPRLIAYWQAAGLSKADAENAIAQRLYWSAAFICYLMRQAGAGTQFKYSVYHTGYCAAAKRNRLQNNIYNPFWLYRTSETAPSLGDLLCNARENSGLTFDNVDDGKNYASHCDIVVNVGQGFVDVIGGNVSDAVTMKRVKTDSRGYVSSKEFYAVLRVGSVGLD